MRIAGGRLAVSALRAILARDSGPSFGESISRSDLGFECLPGTRRECRSLMRKDSADRGSSRSQPTGTSIRTGPLAIASRFRRSRSGTEVTPDARSDRVRCFQIGVFSGK